MKWVIVGGLVVVAVVGGFLLVAGRPALSANVVVDDEVVSVYVGGPRRHPQTLSDPVLVGYVAERHALLERLAKDDPEAVVRAVVVLDRFATAAELEAMRQDWKVDPLEVFLALPGEDYSGGCLVGPGGISQAFTDHLEDFLRIADEVAQADPDNTEIQRHAGLARQGGLLGYAVTVGDGYILQGAHYHGSSWGYIDWRRGSISSEWADIFRSANGRWNEATNSPVYCYRYDSSPNPVNNVDLYYMEAQCAWTPQGTFEIRVDEIACSGYPLETKIGIAVHELGHAIGLGDLSTHSWDRDQVMWYTSSRATYPYDEPGTRGDIYGANLIW
jgi:hypothetical protein